MLKSTSFSKKKFVTVKPVWLFNRDVLVPDRFFDGQIDNGKLTNGTTQQGNN